MGAAFFVPFASSAMLGMGIVGYKFYKTLSEAKENEKRQKEKIQKAVKKIRDLKTLSEENEKRQKEIQKAVKKKRDLKYNNLLKRWALGAMKALSQNEDLKKKLKYQRGMTIKYVQRDEDRKRIDRNIERNMFSSK